MHRGRERGFALIEIAIAASVWVVALGVFFYLAQGMLAAASTGANERRAYLALTQLAATWDAEASSALAIFVPPRDVLGGDNTDGHEIDFYGRDAQHRGHFWAYRWDRSAQTIQRYAYAAAGSPATASGAPVAGITAFAAVRRAASALTPAFLNGYRPKDVAVNFGYPGVDGGNAVTQVRLTGRRSSFEIELLPGTLPSGFAVVVGTFTPQQTPTAPSATLPVSSDPPPPDGSGSPADPSSPGGTAPAQTPVLSSTPAAAPTSQSGAPAPAPTAAIPSPPADVVHVLKCWDEPDPKTVFLVRVVDTWTWDPATWSWVLVPGSPPSGDVFCE